MSFFPFKIDGLRFAAVALVVGYAVSAFWLSFHPDPEPLSAQQAMQTIDLEWIRQNFWQCLIYNHYQPPLFANILVGGLYCIARPWTTHGMLLINIAMATAAFAALIWVLRKVGVNLFFIALAAASFALLPSRWLWEGMVLYVSLSCSLMTFALWAAFRFFAAPSAGRFWALAVPVAALTLLNPFFHWLWGFLTLGCALVLTRPFPRRWIHVAAVSLLILACPLKNAWIFGTPSNSSCSGIVLAQRVGAYAPVLLDDIRKGRLPAEALMLLTPYSEKPYLNAPDPLPEKFKNIRCLTEPWKGYRPEGKGLGVYSFFNYNYYSMIPVSKRMSKYSIQYLMHHPYFYATLTVAQAIDFFGAVDKRLDPAVPLPRKWQFPSSLGLSIRSIVYLFSLLPALCYLWLMRRRRDPRWNTLFFALFQLAFAMGMGIVIAYFDGARYRFPFETTFVWVSAFSLSWLFTSDLFRKSPAAISGRYRS